MQFQWRLSNLFEVIYVVFLLSPAFNEYNRNSTAYCNNMKDHVDCVNKKLKFCKNIQEYGPALETIKWSLKVILAQVGSTNNRDSVLPDR